MRASSAPLPMREAIEAGPRPMGTFTNGVLGGGFVFVSGQPPIDPMTGAIPQDFRQQARQCLRNVEMVVKAAGGSLDDVVKTTVWLHDWSDYAALNEVYAEVFPRAPPARSTVQSARPPPHRLAIEAIALARPR